MVATAERIDFVSHDVDFDPGGPGPSVSRLTVNFKVFRRGPAHVCGLIHTTDFWKTPDTQLAVFQRFEGILRCGVPIGRGTDRTASQI